MADILQTFAQGASSQCRHMTGAVVSCSHNKEPGDEPGVHLSRNLGRNCHVSKHAGNLAGPAANTLFSVSQYERVQSLQLQRSSLPKSKFRQSVSATSSKNGRQPKGHQKEDAEPVIQIAFTSSDYELRGKPVPGPLPPCSTQCTRGRHRTKIRIHSPTRLLSRITSQKQKPSHNIGVCSPRMRQLGCFAPYGGPL